MARRATVLLVEDDAHDAEIMRLAFDRASAPLSLITVADGADAIRYLAGEGQYADRERFPLPHFILLDLAMPLVDGFEVLRWMKTQPPDTMPPVIVLSYAKDEHALRLARNLGAREYLVKSVDLDGTIALVNRLNRYWEEGSV